MKRIHIWLGILVVGLLGQGCDESMGDGGAAAQGEPSANHPGRIVGDSPTSTWSLLPEDDVLEEDGEGLDSESWGDDEGFGEEAVCVPDCQGRQCGPDGCGGTCGNCNDGSVCTLDHCSSVGTCFHVPSGLKGAAEVCNGVDDDCDGLVDEVGAGGCTPFFLDEDGDGFGVGEPVCLCSPNSPHEALQAGDCDDWDGAVFPGQPEACNGKDDDCDGEVESADACAGLGEGLGADENPAEEWDPAEELPADELPPSPEPECDLSATVKVHLLVWQQGFLQMDYMLNVGSDEPSGYKDVERSFKLWDCPGEGRIPVYQSYSAAHQDHLPGLEAEEGKPDYEGHELLGYCSEQPGGGASEELRRYYVPWLSNHLAATAPDIWKLAMQLGGKKEWSCWVP